MGYRVLRNFYVGNTMYEIGQDFWSDNADQVRELLADGNIGPGGSDSPQPPQEATATEAPLVEAPSEPVVLDEPSTPSPEPVAIPVVETVTPQPTSPLEQQIAQDPQVLSGDSVPSSNDLQIS